MPVGDYLKKLKDFCFKYVFFVTKQKNVVLMTQVILGTQVKSDGF
jgi:hypothetical protein